MKKSHLRELRQLANLLPVTYQNRSVFRRIHGSEILKHKPEAKDQKGKAIDPNMHYMIKVSDQEPTNDYRRLKKIYRREGIKAVRQYCQEVHELNQNQVKSVGGLPILQG
jgi:hypothetical protein